MHRVKGIVFLQSWFLVCFPSNQLFYILMRESYMLEFETKIEQFSSCGKSLYRGRGVAVKVDWRHRHRTINKLRWYTMKIWNSNFLRGKQSLESKRLLYMYIISTTHNWNFKCYSYTNFTKLVYEKWRYSPKRW